jgi:hypothetical protein
MLDNSQYIYVLVDIRVGEGFGERKRDVVSRRATVLQMTLTRDVTLEQWEKGLPPIVGLLFGKVAAQDAEAVPDNRLSEGFNLFIVVTSGHNQGTKQHQLLFVSFRVSSWIVCGLANEFKSSLPETWSISSN